MLCCRQNAPTDEASLRETDKMDAIGMVAHDAFHLLFDGFYLFPHGDETADSLIQGYGVKRRVWVDLRYPLLNI